MATARGQASNVPIPSAGGGKVTRLGRDNSTSCTRLPARSRHRQRVWSVLCAKRRTGNRGSAAEAHRVEVPGLWTPMALGTIRGRSVVDGLRSVSVALARERAANDATRGVLADDEPSRACADVRCVQNDRRPRGAVRVLRRRPDSIAVHARSRNRSRDCRLLEEDCGTEGFSRIDCVYWIVSEADDARDSLTP